MAAFEPYYPLHKIETGKYTNGTEFVTDDINQTDYIGLYHILPNGDYWSNSSPQPDSQKLIPKRMMVSPDVKIFNSIRNRQPANYLSPVPYFPILNVSDYQAGYIMRYFVQKRNNPQVTITEIDASQFNTLNDKNRSGISILLWNYVELKWTIKGTHALHLNMQEIQRAISNGFINLQNYLKDPLEFWK
jgi:hypothetical protein